MFPSQQPEAPDPGSLEAYRAAARAYRDGWRSGVGRPHNWYHAGAELVKAMHPELSGGRMPGHRSYGRQFRERELSEVVLEALNSVPVRDH